MNSMILQVFVTSATTFAFTAYGGNGAFNNFADGAINNINTSQTLTSATCSIAIPDLSSWSSQATGNWGQTWSAMIYEVPVPIGSTPNLWSGLATTWLNSTTPGGIIMLELADEIWSDDNITVVASAFADLGVIANQVTGTWAPYVTYQVAASALLRQTFYNVFAAAGRGGEVKLTMNSWGSNAAGGLEPLVAATNAFNVANPSTPCIWDYCASGSMYPVAPSDSTLAVAAASVYAANSNSNQHGNANPWTRQMYLEYLRHFVKYNMDFLANAHDTWYPSVVQYLANYVPVGGQPAGYTPILWCYEASWRQALPQHLQR